MLQNGLKHFWYVLFFVGDKRLFKFLSQERNRAIMAENLRKMSMNIAAKPNSSKFAADPTT